jgi:hypothetical protein
VHIPAGHPGCRLPQHQRVIRAKAHLDFQHGGIQIRPHLAAAESRLHMAVHCTISENFMPRMHSVEVAPLIVGDDGLPVKMQGGGWRVGEPVSMTGADLAKIMSESSDGRRVTGYTAVTVV